MANKTGNQTSLKKFDVIRRDKSQPEVFYRGEKRHLNNSTQQAQSTQQLVTTASNVPK